MKQSSLYRRFFCFGVTAGVLLLIADVAMACPNCKDTLAEQGGRLQYAYAFSIALMIGAPFGILGAWGLAIYRMVRSNLPK
ncbi:MAG: hypothetical protein JNL67_03390 [Planctomycetaceae bacterium]|nr:hypothetical protein [Planctomycetaceae bacterium]